MNAARFSEFRLDDSLDIALETMVRCKMSLMDGRTQSAITATPIEGELALALFNVLGIKWRSVHYLILWSPVSHHKQRELSYKETYWEMSDTDFPTMDGIKSVTVHDAFRACSSDEPRVSTAMNGRARPDPGMISGHWLD